MTSVRASSTSQIMNDKNLSAERLAESVSHLEIASLLYAHRLWKCTNEWVSINKINQQRLKNRHSDTDDDSRAGQWLLFVKIIIRISAWAWCSHTEIDYCKKANERIADNFEWINVFRKQRMGSVIYRLSFEASNNYEITSPSSTPSIWASSECMTHQITQQYQTRLLACNIHVVPWNTGFYVASIESSRWPKRVNLSFLLRLRTI